jgi:hypothetical protein
MQMIAKSAECTGFKRLRAIYGLALFGMQSGSPGHVRFPLLPVYLVWLAPWHHAAPAYVLYSDLGK